MGPKQPECAYNDFQRSHRGSHINCFLPTGELLVSGSVDGTIILWNMVSKMKINTLKHSAIAVAVSPNGQQLASSGYRHVKLWDIRNPKEIREVGTLPHAPMNM